MSKIKKALLLGSIFFAEVAIVCSSFATPARAVSGSGTTVHGNIMADTIWVPENSPYILDGDVNILSGVTLTIKAGTRITNAPGDYRWTLVNSGTLLMQGEKDRLIDVGSINEILTSIGRLDAMYTRLHDGPKLHFLRGSGNIASSSIQNSSGAAFNIWGSTVRATGMRIDSVPTVVFAKSLIGAVTDIRITDSSLTNNPAVVFNADASSVDLRNNWWGASTGPADRGPLAFKGAANYSPWLTEDPLPQICCSNVLFLPGMEGSRLFQGSDLLWEPGSNADAATLFLDENGSTTEKGIYTGGPIDSAYGIKGIYSGFLSFMNGLEKSGLVSRAASYGYDWRKPIDEVVLGSEQRSTTTDSLIAAVEKLAADSKTGKVSIVAHSNGGLVAKYLIRTLADRGRSDLIDRMISVATPFLGTPEAIGAILHGDDQKILGGIFLRPDTARRLGANAAGAYSLLPSAEFFKRILMPSIAFASTTVADLNDGSYPPLIRNAADQNDFIRDTAGVRPRPAFDNTDSPAIGNTNILSRAESIHDLLDHMAWPAAIENFALVGTNRLTAMTENYRARIICNLSFITYCAPKITHFASTTMEGDGTVLAESAAYNSPNTIYFDLSSISRDENTAFSHSNILESSTTQAAIKAILMGNKPASKQAAVATVAGDRLVLSTHSPVELHLYDSSGRHTGAIPKDPLLKTNDLIDSQYEEAIPDSSLRSVEETDGSRETYISVPAAGDYRVEIDGTGFGFFTFETERLGGGGNSIDHQVYMSEPVTPLSVATTTIINGTAKPLVFDIDGDGNGELDVQTGGTGLPGNAETPEAAGRYVADMTATALEQTVSALLKDDPHKQGILEKIAHLKDLAEKGKLKQFTKQSSSIDTPLSHMALKALTAADRKKLLDAIDQMLSIE